MSPGRSATRILKTAHHNYYTQDKVYFDVRTDHFLSLHNYVQRRAELSKKGAEKTSLDLANLQ
jgi:hypothetical protein